MGGDLNILHPTSGSCQRDKRKPGKEKEKKKKKKKNKASPTFPLNPTTGL